jgi:hypothetical protein
MKVNIDWLILSTVEASTPGCYAYLTQYMYRKLLNCKPHIYVRNRPGEIITPRVSTRRMQAISIGDGNLNKTRCISHSTFMVMAIKCDDLLNFQF